MSTDILIINGSPRKNKNCFKTIIYRTLYSLNDKEEESK